MDIDRIRYFQVFTQTGSLVRASEVLHISQPALSKALRLLEMEVGLKLVEPDGRGLRVTRAGQAFQRETAPLLNQLYAIPEKIKGASQQIPTRIGSFEVFSTYFLRQLLKFVALENLDIHEFGPGKLEQALIDNLIDVGITYLPIPTSGVEFIEVTKIRMGIFGLNQIFKGQSLHELPFVIPLPPSEGTPSKVVGLDGWPDHRVKRNIKFRVTMMESALELCRSGVAVAYLPEFVVHLHNEKMRAECKLAELPSPLAQKDRVQSVFLVQKQHAEEASLQRQIAKSLRSLK
jgi:DNA-binding transcriptional LysR family regulator